jgi:hypothetical protein
VKCVRCSGQWGREVVNKVESRQSSRVYLASLKTARVERLVCKADRNPSSPWKGDGAPYFFTRMSSRMRPHSSSRSELGSGSSSG